MTSRRRSCKSLFRNTTLRVSTLPVDPWADIVRVGGEPRLGPTGIYSRIFTAIATHCGFAYNLLLPLDLQFGRKKNNSWSGMSGMMARNEVDASFFFLMTQERFELGDFAGTLFPSHLGILAAHSGELQTDVYQSIHMLDKWTWISVIIAFFICGLIATFTERCLSSSSEIKRTEDSARIPFGESYRKWLWYYLGNIFSENNYNKIKKLPIRILVGVWSLSTMIITYGIQGLLISAITLRIDKRPIETIADILERPNVIPYVPQATAIEFYIKNHGEPEFQQLWRRIEKKNSSVPHNTMFSLDTMHEIMRGEAVVIYEVTTLKHYISKTCKGLGSQPVFYIARQTFLESSSTILLNRNLPPRQLQALKRKSMKLSETGLIPHWVSELGRYWHVCAAHKAQHDNRPLTLEDLQGIFYVWVTGMGCSIFYFGVELCSSYATKQRASRHRL